MHMADALVSPAVAGIMYAVSIVAAGFAIKKTSTENIDKKIPLMGVLGAFIFAAQMINFTIPGTGSSGHLCGGMLLSAILGPSAGFLTMIAILTIQCLLFADGGILALGCNIWNMAFYGCFIGGFLIWRAFTKGHISKRRIVLASIIGCVLSLELGAFSVTLETLCSGISELPFWTFMGFMLPIHLVIGIVEGLITAAVLVFIYNARPELLWGYSEGEEVQEKMSFKAVLGVLAILAIVIAGLVSLFASANPDGLEWSLSKITGSTELESSNSAVQAMANSFQNNTAILPDYALKGSDAAAGTSLSGIVGSIVVLILCALICIALKKFKTSGKNS